MIHARSLKADEYH